MGIWTLGLDPLPKSDNVRNMELPTNVDRFEKYAQILTLLLQESILTAIAACGLKVKSYSLKHESQQILGPLGGDVQIKTWSFLIEDAEDEILVSIGHDKEWKPMVAVSSTKCDPPLKAIISGDPSGDMHCIRFLILKRVRAAAKQKSPDQ